MTAVPGATPVITPPTEIVATAGFELPHVPPDVASATEIVCPWHTLDGPVIGPGTGSTVMVTVE
jgi:hypothetical protein